MSNALDDNEQQQICALGRLGWPLLRIQRATGVRRETVSGYLKAAGIPVRPWAAERTQSKTGNYGGGVHRLWTKTGNFPVGGVHRLTADTSAERERLCAVPRAD